MSRGGRLWAPWRHAYVARHEPLRACIFCAAKRNRDGHTSHVVYRGPRVFCLLNRYPYNAGHLLISVYRHIGDPTRLTDQESSELMQTTTMMMRALTAVLRPHGFNIGMNVGRAAGAGIPGHLHMHVVPRWVEDTNFMPVLTETKIISQALNDLQKQLRRHLARVDHRDPQPLRAPRVRRS